MAIPPLGFQVRSTHEHIPAMHYTRVTVELPFVTLARSWTGNHEISEMSLDGQRPARVGARGDEQPALLVRAVLR